MPSLLRFLLLLLSALNALGLYEKDGAVVSLDENSYYDLVINSHIPAVVEFYAPWCKHCIELASQYKKVADNLKGIAIVGAVDCDAESNKKLCSSSGIRGFPTLKIFSAEKEKNPYTGKYFKTPNDYQGAKTAKSIVAAVTATLTDARITKIKSSADYDNFVSTHSALPKALLFTNKAESSVLYKSLSTQYQGRAAFAEVHESVAEVAELHAITQHPTFIVLAADGTSHKYEGELGAVPLGEFVKQYAAAAPAGSGSGSDKAEGSKEAPGLKVAPANTISLEELAGLDAKEEMVLAAFYSAAGDECADSISELQKVVQEMHGVVVSVLVNAKDADAELVGKYGLDGALLASSPCTLQPVALPYGKDKQDLDEYQRYEGPMEAKALQKFVFEAGPDLTAPLNPDTLNRFLMSGDIGMRGLPLPKVVLVTNKDEVPGVFKMLAINLASTGLGFGWVKSHIEDNKPILTQLSIKKVPQMVVIGLYPPESAELKAKGQMPMMINPYNGPTKYNYMSFWLQQLVAQLGGIAAGAGDQKSLVPLLANNADLQTHCAERGGLCVIAMLAPASPSFADQHTLLSKMAVALRDSPMHIMWVRGREQPGFMAELGLKPKDIPAVAVLSPKKLRYALLLEAFSEQNIKELLDGVLSGKVRTSPLDALPSLIEGSAGGAQEEAQVTQSETPPAEEEPPVEEEFDLSEIMAEDLEGSLGSKEEKLKEVEEKLKEEEEAKKKAEKKKKKTKSKKAKKAKGGDKDEL